MLRKVVCALFLVGLSIGIAAGEELKGRIVKIDDKKVTFQTFTKKKADEPKDYDLAKDVKVFKMEKEEKVSVSEGVKSDLLKGGEKGVRARIVTTDGKVTEIVVEGKRKKTD